MRKFEKLLKLSAAGFADKDRVDNIPGWPYEIGDEICIPSDLAIEWNLNDEQRRECVVITDFYSNSSRQRLFANDGLNGDHFWELYYVQWTPREALRKALQWIDQVPLHISQCVKTSLCRDAMEKLLAGESDSMSYADALSVVLDWVDELTVKAVQTLPDFPRRQIEDGRDHLLACLPESARTGKDNCNFVPEKKDDFMSTSNDALRGARFDSPDEEHEAWLHEQDVKYGRVETSNDKERGLRQEVLDKLALEGTEKPFDATAVARGGLVSGGLGIGANTAEALLIDHDTYTVEVALLDGRLAYFGGDGKHPYLPKEQAEDLAAQVNSIGVIDPRAWIDGSGYPLGFPAAARRELEREREAEDDRSGLDHGM